MVDSDNRVLDDSAHAYMECSNRGYCERNTGQCFCADGYEGAACQRAICPGFPTMCSGHGVCKTIQQLADLDHGNTYELWDRTSTMGCDCDKGFHGPDCSKVQKCNLFCIYLSTYLFIHLPVYLPTYLPIIRSILISRYDSYFHDCTTETLQIWCRSSLFR